MKYKTPKTVEDILDIAFDLQYRASKRCEDIEQNPEGELKDKLRSDNEQRGQERKRLKEFLETTIQFPEDA